MVFFFVHTEELKGEEKEKKMKPMILLIRNGGEKEKHLQKDPHHVLSKDHKTELARRRPRDGAGATETARRSWRDEDRCNGGYSMA